MTPSRAASPSRYVIGWDIGGAHVKACLMRDGRVVDVAQWACPLWQGMVHLEQVLEAARAHWPPLADATHAVTMTGEMTDLFEHRQDGVQRIAALLSDVLAPATVDRLLLFGGDFGDDFGDDFGGDSSGDVADRYGGGSSRNVGDRSGSDSGGDVVRRFASDPGDHGDDQRGDILWCQAADAGVHWQRIASANWLATALHAAQCIAEGVLIDIGSTTTDLIAFRAGRVLGTSRSDAERLASGELVYQGVVRTPLCALGPRIAWQGRSLNVMNEFFATTADVYRLSGELDPVHDLHPSADNAPKDLPATRRRLARMIGLDARDAPDADWLAFALEWRERQVDELASQLRRVLDRHALSNAAVAVSAGCGDFLAADVVARAGAALACRRYGSDVARLADGAAAAASSNLDRDVGSVSAARWAQVCAPSVAVAALFDRERR